LEILISLLIVSTVSLGLINTQWLIQKQINQLDLQLQEWFTQSNQAESAYTGLCTQ
jgi:hypothetical protein